jgi:hypothetical protein
MWLALNPVTIFETLGGRAQLYGFEWQRGSTRAYSLVNGAVRHR